MTAPATIKPAASTGPSPTPPLEAGDHLTRDEFERRYDAMPEVKKAELIEGMVHIPSLVRLSQYAGRRADLITWLGTYRAYTAGVRAGYNPSIRLDLDNEPQPDAALIVEPSHGGRVRFSHDDYVVGGPELIAEAASSKASIELHTKLHVYRRSDVREYIVWRVQEQAVDWFVNRQGRYDRLPLTAAGIYQSEVFPGLWLDPASLARADLATVLQVLQQGIASPEHVAFVARLRQVAADEH